MEIIFQAKLKLKKGYNSQNWGIIHKSNDLYFIITYLCIKYESNKIIFFEDNEWKPIFVRDGLTVVILYAPPIPPPFKLEGDFRS